MGSCRLLFCDEISDTANCVNLYLGPPFEEVFSQAMNVYLDGIGGDVTGQSENVVFGQLLGDDAVPTTHQQFEYHCFSRRQHLRLLIDECLSAFGIECEICDLKRASEKLARTPQECFQARYQFFERKRLYEIVIRTSAKTAHAIMQPPARRQHEN